MISPRSIMLIDDDPDDQLFFREALQIINPDLRCELATTCQQAFRQLEITPHPDFIFMDLNMPVMNGFDCLFYFKNHPEYKDIPVVIFTTSKNKNDIKRTQDLGAKWYLAKPDDFNVLCKKLEIIIQQEPTNGTYFI
jgi:CheY-like chemotaxis protein